MEIYTKEDQPIKRYIDIEVEDGKFRMDLQDLGPGAGDEGEYERSASDISVELLKEAFEVQFEEELLQKIAKEFGTADGFDRFILFCRKNWIEFAYWAG